MTADPRDRVSDFTEITDEELALLIGTFFRAIGWGAVAGGGVFLVGTVPLGLAMLVGDGEPRGLLVALLPLGIAFAGALAGMTLIGLPLTAFLRHFRREQTAIYATIGIIGGVLLPVLFAGWFEGEFNGGSIGAGLFLGLFGAMAGGVTGNIWGNYRESLARPDSQPVDETEDTTNPYHDMIY
ncbi:hypothetical protein [Aurantiacibacter hainanensis]|uniref:hypothetical protein n=1 Tax=Aurantiacibacter hainanensis TaxID=3076114 RepID=UPI0030C71F72